MIDFFAVAFRSAKSCRFKAPKLAQSWIPKGAFPHAPSSIADTQNEEMGSRSLVSCPLRAYVRGVLPRLSFGRVQRTVLCGIRERAGASHFDLARRRHAVCGEHPQRLAGNIQYHGRWIDLADSRAGWHGAGGRGCAEQQ